MEQIKRTHMLTLTIKRLMCFTFEKRTQFNERPRNTKDFASVCAHTYPQNSKCYIVREFDVNDKIMAT